MSKALSTRLDLGGGFWLLRNSHFFWRRELTKNLKVLLIIIYFKKE